MMHAELYYVDPDTREELIVSDVLVKNKLARYVKPRLFHKENTARKELGSLEEPSCPQLKPG